MSEDNLKDILSNYEEKITERKIDRLSKRIRRARYIVLLITILNMLAFAAVYYKGFTDYFHLGAAGVFLLLFLLSGGSKPYMSLTAAAIIDIVLTVSRSINAFKYSSHEDMTQDMAFKVTTIVVIVHLVFITYLILGAKAAKQFEEIKEQ